MFLGRTESHPRTKYFIIEQRMGEFDTTALILEKAKKGEANYKQISIPYYFAERQEIKSRHFNFIFNQGEYISKRFDDFTKQTIIAQRGHDIFLTEYQQTPVKRTGVYIPIKNIGYYYQTDNIFFKTKFITIDTAQKTGTHNDYSVACLWGVSDRQHLGRNGEVYNTGLFLIDMYRAKAEYPELKQNIINFYNRHQTTQSHLIPISSIHIEDKQNGTALIGELKKILNVSILPLVADKSKTERANLLLSPMDAGRIYLPHEKEEMKNIIINELRNFTGEEKHKHDDIVDNFAYAVQVLNKTSFNVNFEELNRHW